MDENPKISIRRLYQKIHAGLSKKFINEVVAHGQKFYRIENDQIIGRIEWDDQYDGRLPKIVIDGKAYTWEQVGEMMMTYEGFKIKVQIEDMGNDNVIGNI